MLSTCCCWCACPTLFFPSAALIPSLFLCLSAHIISTTITTESQHKWNKDASDWGFTQFLPYLDALNPDKGFLVNDTLKIKVEIQVQVRMGVSEKE